MRKSSAPGVATCMDQFSVPLIQQARATNKPVTDDFDGGRGNSYW